MKLNEIRLPPGAAPGRKRLGRGIGSGLGKTSGKGHKGQKARAGGTRFVGFEGGQMPLYRRLPKRGFRNPFTDRPAIINVGDLQKAVERQKLNPAEPVTIGALQAANLVGKRETNLRLLAKGRLTTALQLEVDTASAAAISAVEKAGGSVICRNPREKAGETPGSDAEAAGKEGGAA